MPATASYCVSGSNCDFDFLYSAWLMAERILGEQQRVAVRIGRGDVVPGEIAAGAGPVLDHDRLAERGLEVF